MTYGFNAMLTTLHFFATRADITSVLGSIEIQHAVKYVPAGLFDESHIPCWLKGSEAPDLGKAFFGDRNHERAYLILDVHTETSVRAVPQRNGSVKYAVYQDTNPASIAFWPGGVFGNTSVIQGEFSTCSHVHTILRQLT